MEEGDIQSLGVLKNLVLPPVTSQRDGLQSRFGEKKKLIFCHAGVVADRRETNVLLENKVNFVCSTCT